MNGAYKPDIMRRNGIPIASAGYPHIFIVAFTTFIFALSGLTILSLAGLALTIFVCAFFRDPDRMIPDTENAVVSPADGKVIVVSDNGSCPFIEGRFTKISIFMSVFNVHVNRIPYDGVIRQTVYRPGKFLSANLDKASKDNEHHAVIMETPDGGSLCFVQIAGLVARRIISYIGKGDTVLRGRRFGMICFGSRLDVYLPTDVGINVAIGDKVKAGSSIIGFLKGPSGIDT